MSQTQQDQKPDMVTIGRLGRPFGFKGQIHLQSFTDPFQNILDYPELFIEHQKQWQKLQITSSKINHDRIILTIESYHSKEEVSLLTNSLIATERRYLPPTEENESYWSDLEGLEVINHTNTSLGHVSHLIRLHANDALVIKRKHKKNEILVPYLNDFITEVDHDAGIIHVIWDDE